MLLGFPLDF
jgi:hypothetical protein